MAVVWLFYDGIMLLLAVMELLFFGTLCVLGEL